MAIATAAAIIGGASSIYGVVDGISQKNKAKKALDNLKVPELGNPYKDLSVSTEGSDLIREEGQRRTANILGSLQGGSARNIFSALPSLVNMNNSINQKAALDIDNQMQKREYAIAGYEEKRNKFDEDRYQNELAGIGTMYNQGNHQMWNGIKGTIAAAGSLERSFDNNDDVDDGISAEERNAGSFFNPITTNSFRNTLFSSPIGAYESSIRNT